MPYAVEMRLGVQVPMRDGVKLSADLYLPQAHGPFPTVLVRTPYSNNNAPAVNQARALANNGYACVLQDTRGRWDSGGDYYPLQGEGVDGYDTQEWIGQQPWSNGKIATSGASYLGHVQWQSAPDGSHYLTAMAPRVIGPNFFKALRPGGAFQLGLCATWGAVTSEHTNQLIDYHNWTELFYTLPLTELDGATGRNLAFWQDLFAHPTYDDYWAALNIEERWGEITVPAFNMGGWYDIFIEGSFACFNGLRQHGGSPAARQSKLIVGPWVHALSVSPKVGDVDFGFHSMQDLDALEFRWIEQWLKGVHTGILDEAPLRLFIMGSNEWRDEYEWPLARTEWQHWHLHSGGQANTLRGDGVLAPVAPGDEPMDHFVYDPHYPVQSHGGNTCCAPQITLWGPYDQRAVEMRADVLCYTSEPLAADLEVTGPIQLILYAATDAPDTDWTAKLVDVAPSGYAKNLCDGIVRARYRESITAPTLVTPHQVYEYVIEVGVTGNVFRKGHRLRLEVSSSNFPRFDRNPNTGATFGHEHELRVARQTIYHDRAYPSHLILPVIPKP
ncbi:MAG: CocE/NonD family hydrolase [Caldilineaceae bacterium]|nr:CocE/NonD family hydrolase [Caldilineaceae bacterium]